MRSDFTRIMQSTFVVIGIITFSLTSAIAHLAFRDSCIHYIQLESTISCGLNDLRGPRIISSNLNYSLTSFTSQTCVSVVPLQTILPLLSQLRGSIGSPLVIVDTGRSVTNFDQRIRYLRIVLRMYLLRIPSCTYRYVCPYCRSVFQEIAGISNPKIGTVTFRHDFSPDVILTVAYFKDAPSLQRCLNAPWETSSFVKSGCNLDTQFLETLAEYHNISISYRTENILKETLPYGFQITSFSSDMWEWQGPVFYYGGMHEKMIYCQPLKGGFHSITVWLSPFQKGVWGLLMGSLALVVICVKGGSLSALTAILFRQPITTKLTRAPGGLLLIVSLFLLGLQYENYLTSRLIVPEQDQYFKTLPQVVNDGYTIMQRVWSKQKDIQYNKFKDDYRRNCILDKLNATMRTHLGGTWKSVDIARYLAFKNSTTKYALLEREIDGFYSNLLLQQANGALAQRKQKCYKVPEVLGSDMYLVRFVSHIGDSFVHIATRLRESGILWFFTYELRGLLQKANLRESRPADEEEETKVQQRFIHLSDLTALLVALFVLYIIATLSFICEVMASFHYVRSSYHNVLKRWRYPLV